MESLGRLPLLAFSVVTVVCCLVPSSVNGMPTNTNPEQTESSRDDDRRATWLETRNLKNNFKQLVMLSIQELADDGLIDPRVLSEKVSPDKRGRHQGFCFRKTKSGRFLPYICWKGEGDQEDK
jgi:hypothetical protein